MNLEFWCLLGWSLAAGQFGWFVHARPATDINMPGISGLELLPKAKAARPDIPVIMITAYGDDNTRRKVLEGGAEALLTKPIDFVALRTEIDGRVASAA
jgi:CheY-like chemotaxis protein